jgi:hypothetical protein
VATFIDREKRHKKVNSFSDFPYWLTHFSARCICWDVWVDGYYKKNGTYVPGHRRTKPDGNRWNNWSTQGNYNPYTGKKGSLLGP